ncbi:hypothetical protein B0H11DRAFT_1908598 [Mycena galericulata]|nr:hypothetical protein B0H11DRAFT_1908598 [Mycena galericulata]
MPSPSIQSARSWLRDPRVRFSRVATTDNIIYSILGLVTLAVLFYVGVLYTKETLPIERELLSRLGITTDTPISGFYGPGPWWGWLITLGMSHGHTLMALKSTNPEPNWDYDLIGASFYLVTAEIDLILKAKEISQLGDRASDYSGLLPALLCAERAVAVGNGFCLFTIITAFLFNYSSRFRAAGITAIPLILGIVASFSTLHAHKAIFQTVPARWWSLHRGIEELSFTLVDFPAWLITSIVSMAAPKYASQTYWMASIGTGSVGAIVWEVYLGQPHNIRHTLGLTLLAGAILAASFPCLEVLAWVVFGGPHFLFFWFLSWFPVYILAFCPYMGYFPLTGTTRSVLDMDQFSALLAVVVVALIRIWQSIHARYFKVMIHHHFPSGQELESGPLLPSSSSDTSCDSMRQTGFLLESVLLWVEIQNWFKPNLFESRGRNDPLELKLGYAVLWQLILILNSFAPRNNEGGNGGRVRAGWWWETLLDDDDVARGGRRSAELLSHQMRHNGLEGTGHFQERNYAGKIGFGCWEGRLRHIHHFSNLKMMADAGNLTVDFGGCKYALTKTKTGLKTASKTVL